MKKTITLFLALILMLSVLPARAEGAKIEAAYMPAEITAFFSQSKFDGCVIQECAFDILETASADYAFAIVSKGKTNTLYGFENKGSGWKYWLVTNKALPAAEGLLQVSCFNKDSKFKADTLRLELWPDGITGTVSVPYQAEFELSGTRFLLTAFRRSAPYDFTDARAEKDRVSYYSQKNGSLVGRAYGSPERDLRYFSYSAFPKTYQEAVDKLSVPPEIPGSSQLQAQNIQFTGGQKYDVYSGPGQQYERGANGKAKVSTNDWIQVFGTEGDYILIQYAISSSQMRFGYILKSSLPKKASVSPLVFDWSDAVITENTCVTDDPLNSVTKVRNLSAGDSVQWLAQMGNWVYVEVTGGTPLRGFVPLKSVTRSMAKNVSGEYGNNVYFASADGQITGSAFTAVVRLTGPAAWNVDPEQAVTGYRLLANNQWISASQETEDTGSSAFFGRSFTLSATLPAGTDLIALCPVYASGIQGNEMLMLNIE